MKTVDSAPLRKLSPYQELKQNRKELWEKLKHEMPEEHAELYDQLVGKPPKDMARIIVDAFTKIFPTKPDSEELFLGLLYPEFFKKQPISFTALSSRLSTLELWFRHSDPCLELINSLRIIFQLLERPKNSNRKERVTVSDDVSFPPDKIKIEKCRFCWRTVWWYPTENGTPKCSNHEVKSSTKEHKHIRIVEKKYNSIFVSVGAHYRQLQHCMQGENGGKILPNAFAVRLCSLLPHVSAFITEELNRNPNYDKAIFENDMANAIKSYDNFTDFDLFRVPWEQQHEYMRNHPHPSTRFVRTVLNILDPHDGLAGNLALAREQFVMNMTWGFAAYAPYLLEAEAWMMAEELSQHGGKRKGAGKKPNLPKWRLFLWVLKTVESFYRLWRK